jgi:HEXXH motif-containing protein
MLIGNHQLPGPAFALLSHGHGDAAAIRALATGQVSRRSLLLRAVVEEAVTWPQEECAGGLRVAVELLDRVQRRAPTDAAAVFGYPLVGAWVALCLRRLRALGRYRARVQSGTGSRPPLDDDRSVPLWVDLGHLAAVAAAAAVRAGLPVEIAVPLRGGVASLPTLGQAHLPSGASYGVAVVSGDRMGYRIEGVNGSVAIPEPSYLDADGWSGLRRLVPSRGTESIAVYLDDLDPYRGGHGLAAAPRLDDDTYDGWSSLFAAALKRLATHHPQRLAELAGWPLAVVPLVDTSDDAGANATARDSVGAMALTPPPNPIALAHSVIHEYQHSKLGAILDLVDLYDRQDVRRYYSPWRADPRPLSGLLQGVYAFLAVAEAWSAYVDSPPDGLSAQHVWYEFVRTRAQVAAALTTVAGSRALTPAGRRFVAGVRDRVDTLCAVAAPPDLVRLADLVNDDHRLTWRVRNIRVGSGYLDALVEAWRSGARCPHPTAEATVAVAAPAYAEEPRHELVRHLVAGRAVHGRAADLALVDGEHSVAAAAFLAGIRAEPRRVDGWTGLAAVRIGSAPDAVARVYRDRLEVLVTMYDRLGGAADPDALAEWLAD